MKYAITPALVLLFLQKNIAFVKGNRLPPLENTDLNNSGFDPDILGKYHLDAFIALEEKYKETNGFPISLSEVTQDMKDILVGYCSNSDESYGHCLNEANRFTSENYHADLTPGTANSLLSENVMERLENTLISSHANNKESTLSEIYALKQELHENENDENQKMIGHMTLSIAAESFRFWHDVVHNENHVFHRRREDSNRELQTFEIFGQAFCLNIFTIVQADYDGALKEYNKQDVGIPDFNGIIAILYATIVHSLDRFLNPCEFPTATPSSSPTKSASPTTSSPSSKPSEIPSTSPSSLPSQTVMPSESPFASPSTAPSESMAPSVTFFPTSDAPFGSPSTAPSESMAPSLSLKPSSSIKTLEPTSKPSDVPSIIPSDRPSDIPSVKPSEPPSTIPTISISPTVGEETLNELITCVAVIDESYETSVTYFDEKWNRFRVFFPERPFCLLQPSQFVSVSDAQNYAYGQGINVGSGISIPNNFYNDPNQIFASVKRDSGDASQLSDWYEICNLEGLRGQGIARVAFFIDESGSMTRDNVQASLDYFQEQLKKGGVEIVGAIYNDLEDWITPFLTNFGFDGPTITDPDIICRNESVSEKISRWMRKVRGDENKA